MKPTTSNNPIVKRNPYYFRVTKKEMETPRGVSLTVQDDSYSVRDIFEKFTSGQDLGLDRNTFFSEEADHEDHDLEALGRMDISERGLLLEETKRRAQENLNLLKQLDDKKESKKAPKINPLQTAKGELEDDAEARPEDDNKPEPKKVVKNSGQKSDTLS
ncbi:MAG: hypothetical protein [Microvirus sp.]|nr:MAG: hypothetical protein [Microvirus sp.]